MEARSGEAAGDRPKSRAPELEDSLNRQIYHPLAHRVAAALRHTFVTPNAVSAFSGLSIAAAAFFYTRLDAPLSVLLGFLAHALWHVLDGADGDLARMTGKTSPLGELVDGAADYIGHGILYIALAAMLDDALGLWAWALGVAAAGSRIAQANHAESGRRTYLWRVYGIPWLKQAPPAPSAAASLAARTAAAFGRGYVRLAEALGPESDRVDEAFARAAPGPEQDRVRALCREAGRRTLPLQTFLGPNWRTVALAASMAAGSPLWFFLLESTLLNALLALSVVRQRRADRALVDAL